MKAAIHDWLTEQFGPDDELFEELYEQYAADMKSMAAKLEHQLSICSVVSLGQSGHAMKGLALQMGDTEVADLCKALQDAGRTGNLDGCIALVPSVIAAVAAL